MFCRVKVGMREAEPGSSGARVMSLMLGRLVEPYTEAGEVDGSLKRDELCAPFLEGCRYGPSA